MSSSFFIFFLSLLYSPPSLPLAGGSSIVIRIGPAIEPVRPSVQLGLSHLQIYAKLQLFTEK
jgi:hypothetical protein